MTGELSDWNDRIEELIREIIKKAGRFLDLLTLSRFLASWEIRNNPQFPLLADKPIEEVITHLYNEPPDNKQLKHMRDTLEVFLSVEPAREKLNDLRNRLREVSSEITKWPLKPINWRKVAAALPTMEELNLIGEILGVLDANSFFQQILDDCCSGEPGWEERSARMFFIEQIVVRIENIVGILSGEVQRKEVAAKYIGAEEPLSEEPAESSEASGANLFQLWGEILKVLLEEFKDKKGFVDYLEGIVDQFSDALRRSNRLENIRLVCEELVELYKLLPKEKQQEYHHIFQQFLETALGDSSLLTKFRALAYLLSF